MAAPEGMRKKLANRLAPAVSAAHDFYANANAEWLNANPMPARRDLRVASSPRVRNSNSATCGRGDAIAAGQRPATARDFGRAA
jgi:hypothetical protein